MLSGDVDLTGGVAYGVVKQGSCAPYEEGAGTSIPFSPGLVLTECTQFWEWFTSLAMNPATN